MFLSPKTTIKGVRGVADAAHAAGSRNPQLGSDIGSDIKKKIPASIWIMRFALQKKKNQTYLYLPPRSLKPLLKRFCNWKEIQILTTYCKMRDVTI